MVADAISGSSWTLPHPRSHQEVEFHAYLTTLTLPLSHDVNDVFEWVAGDSPLRVFRSSTTWEVLRPRQEKKDWVDAVLFKGAVPKHCFTMWVANYDRLPTRSRFAGWGMLLSAECAFCSRFDETRDHLMLTCEYSNQVWKAVLLKCQSPSTQLTNWSELLSWIRASPSKKLTLLRKLATQTTIFHLWKQRNNLMHNQTSIPPESVFYGIDKDMRNIISARRLSKHFHSLMAMWLS